MPLWHIFLVASGVKLNGAVLLLSCLNRSCSCKKLIKFILTSCLLLFLAEVPMAVHQEIASDTPKQLAKESKKHAKDNFMRRTQLKSPLCGANSLNHSPSLG